MKPEVVEKNKKRKKNVLPHPYKKTGRKQRDKDQRRADHETRVVAWRALAPEVQLMELDRRGMRAVRQRERIQKSI